jgi:hypothetical protein
VVYAKRQTPIYQLPELCLKFTIPATHAIGLPIGPDPHCLSVVIRTQGRVEITGKTIRFLEEQVERFVRRMARYGFARPVPAVMEREEKEVDGVLHKGDRRNVGRVRAAAELNARGIGTPTGGPWLAKTVIRALAMDTNGVFPDIVRHEIRISRAHKRRIGRH